MGAPYSLDLRERVVAAVEHGGMSRNQAARYFGVAISTAIAWVALYRKPTAWRLARWVVTSRARSRASIGPG